MTKLEELQAACDAAAAAAQADLGTAIVMLLMLLATAAVATWATAWAAYYDELKRTQEENSNDV
jgi:multisubunit Na+/H+ antiporter MnhG subunit